MKVFLCEKPSQGATISKHVGATQRGSGVNTGAGVAVTWGIGHLVELAKPEHYNPGLKSWDISLLPVVPQKWAMEIKDQTKAQFQVVAKTLKSATSVVIATDADREGEVIARELLDKCGYRGPIQRLWLGALDDASVKKGLAKLLPNEKTLPLYQSGMGRGRADWLAGLNMTMALTSAFGSGGSSGVLHCGRVQTPVLSLIVRRERAIVGFKPKTFYALRAVFELKGVPVPMAWRMPKERLDAEGHCVDATFIKSIATKVQGKTGCVNDVSTTPEREQAPLLYSLGALQQDANKRYGLKASTVLEAAQALYEKHKATSYPRTDCEYLPVSMFAEASEVLGILGRVDAGLSKLCGAATLDKHGRAFNDAKVTAHHAIIPTTNPNVRMADMNDIERKVYDLVRRRYLAQFLGAYEFSRTVLQVVCEGEQFTATGSTPTRQGWKLAYEGLQDAKKPTKAKEAPKDEDADVHPADAVLPPVVAGAAALNRKAEVATEKTKPPKRYTEGTLLAAMEAIDKVIDDPRLKKVMQTKEKAGIGTDATRASIIEGLLKRSYIEANGKNLVPTDRGNHLVSTIEEIAPELADPVLTALWEEQLNQIEAGTLKLEQFECNLAHWLEQIVGKIKAKAATLPRQARQPKSDVEQPSEVYPCPDCKKSLRRRNGANGFFWGCSGYPTCKCTLPDEDGKPGVRRERAASAHPSTKQPTKSGKPASVPSGKKCPTCSTGTLVERKTKDGKPMIGCSNFPQCRHFEWKK